MGFKFIEMAFLLFGTNIEKIPYEVSDIPFTEQIINIRTTSQTDRIKNIEIQIKENLCHK
jgi:hypothetical protein